MRLFTGTRCASGTVVERLDCSPSGNPKVLGGPLSYEWGSVKGHKRMARRTALAWTILSGCVNETAAVDHTDRFTREVVAQLPGYGWSLWRWQIVAWVEAANVMEGRG